MKTIPKVKICGIRSMNDIEILNEYRPDYCGFVFAESKRKVGLTEVKELIPYLQKEILPVGVFVDQEITFIMKAIEAGIKVVQLHGDEDQQFINELKIKINNNQISIWKVIRINKEIASDREPYLNINGLIFDKYSAVAYGGTGVAFNWDILSGKTFEAPIVLAGGLTADNLKDAVRIVNPFCVDVSSSVETHGYKDKEKVKVFVKKLKSLNLFNSQ
ncbi:phosphoribosylanthranilate isomerase [Alkaliphilus peptidifermentans]|nr:phosphoribosylanthranilate isomerase [Alkaliphilus peptidifermentans]